MKALETVNKNIDFYNEIANNYDAILDDESSNEHIRNKVKEKFMSLVKTGWVLDFGGGTGRDLDWLIDNNYRVIFCEPSEGMRQKAINQHQNDIPDNRLIFLDDKRVDFTTWQSHPPFSIKTDAIISDFAVINCIGDIELLFKNLSGVIKPGGHFLALMLQHGYKKSRIWKLRQFFRSLVSSNPLVLNVNYNNYRQTVYMYTPNVIQKASSPYFEMHSAENLFEFTLFHFVRK